MSINATRLLRANVSVELAVGGDLPPVSTTVQVAAQSEGVVDVTTL